MKWARPLLRIAASIAILSVLARILDVDLVLTRLRTLSPEWVVLGLVLSVAQGAVLAWRWRFTARRLGVELPYRTAIEEYYLGNFLNQVLPGGVVGDVSRAWRHARTDAPGGSAVRAVILERLSGQIVMTIAAFLSVTMLPGLPGVLRGAGAVGLAAVLVALTLLISGSGTSASISGSLVGRFAVDARRAVLHSEALPFQLLSAAFVVGTYIAIYLIGARALHDPTTMVVLGPLVAPVLMTMLLPVSVAGWGVREASAAALWGAVGLTPEDGVAISVTYGILVLVSTAPGAMVLIGSLGRGRSRTGRRHRGGSGGPEAASPRSDSESGPG